MQLDRNRYFMLGVVLFFMGMQFRLVDSFVLNENSTRALQRIVKQAKVAEGGNPAAANPFMQSVPLPKKSFKPPQWLGFVLLTVGGVVSLHALVLPKQ